MDGTVWVYQYDIAALVYLIVLFALLWQFKHISTESNKAFRLLLWSAILTTLFDLLGTWVLTASDIVPLYLNYIVQMLYMIFLYGCGLSYYHLTYWMIRPFRAPSLTRKVAIILISVIDVSFIVTSPFTKLVFYLEPKTDGTPGYTYLHGPVLYVLYGIAFLLMILCLYDAIRYHRLLTKAQQRTVYSWTLACILGMALQIILPGVNMICFAMSLSILLAYFALQNPSDYEDSLTGLNNRAGFMHVLNSYFRRDESFSLICIDYDNFDYVKNVFGEKALNTAIETMSKRLQSVITKNSIFVLSQNRYAICMPHQSENIREAVSKLIILGDLPIDIYGAQVKFAPTFCVIHAPESVTYAEDVPGTIDYALAEAFEKAGSRTYYEVRESAIVKRHRDSAISHILQRSITNNEFKLAFQPVFSAQNARISGAEVFARLEDHSLGQINPNEFIPIAEKNGMIIELGELVLETVCNFIENIPESSAKLEFISINLSPIQCFQADFADNVIKIISKHNINPSMIAFEITPEAAKHSLETLIPNMRRLTEFGVSFLIDRYTVNLSSISFLSALPFTGVKISKETVMAASRNNEMLTALRNVIGTFKNANLRVIAIGIESKDLSESFNVLGCDYLQGYHLSMPLTPEDFLQSISSDN